MDLETNVVVMTCEHKTDIEDIQTRKRKAKKGLLWLF